MMINKTVLTSSLISSSIVALGLFLAPAQEKATIDAGATLHRHQSTDNIAVANIDTVANNLQQSQPDKIDELLANHQELADWYFTLEQRITELEQGFGNDSMTTATYDTNIVNESVLKTDYQPSKVEIEYEENMLALQESDNRFDTLKAWLASEPHDANWQAEMEESLIDVQQRLVSFNLPQADINHMECGDQTCLVEFITDAKIDPHIYSGLLAAQSAGEVVMTHESDGDRNRVLALYRR
jgi:hypothetical protein